MIYRMLHFMFSHIFFKFVGDEPSIGKWTLNLVLSYLDG